MKKKTFKSAISLALSLLLVFSATAIFSAFTASAAEKTDSKTYGFENFNVNYPNANSSFSKSNDVHRTGDSSLKFNFSGSSNDIAIHKAFLNESSGNFFTVTEGEKYKVTFYYMIKGSFSEPYQFRLYTGSNLYGDTKLQNIADPLSFPTTETEGWTKFETVFTANPQEKATNLCIGIRFPKMSEGAAKDYSIYIDDFTIEKTKTIKFGFENTRLSDSTANTSFTVTDEDCHGDEGGKSIKVYKKDFAGGWMRFLLTSYNFSEGVKYNVQWGKTYKITFWYKTVGNANISPLKLGVSTGSGNFADSSTVTVQKNKPAVEFETTPTDGWKMAETTFTAVEKSQNSGHIYLGLDVYIPKIENNTDYKVYIDDVTVSEMETGDVNCDGEINSNDLALLRMALLGIDVNAYNCNVNDDTVVDIRDLVALKKLFSEIQQ